MNDDAPRSILEDELALALLDPDIPDRSEHTRVDHADPPRGEH